MAAITGTRAGDTLAGTADVDLIRGKAGPDFLVGRQADDVILGGAGNDVIHGDNAPLPGSAPQPGDFGPSPVFYGGTPGNNLILAGSGNGVAHAGAGSDLVFGGHDDDTLFSHGIFLPSRLAYDVLVHADGPDYLLGGSGKDALGGGGGSDLPIGEEGDDRLTGGIGGDMLIGGPGRVVFNCGADTGLGPGSRDVVLDFHHSQDLLDLSDPRRPFAGPNAPPPVFLGDGPFVASFALQVR